jgi:hypothetical protein
LTTRPNNPTPKTHNTNNHVIIEQAISNLRTMALEGRSNADLVEELRIMQISMNYTNEYKYYMLICGLFDEKRSMFKLWSKHESAFLDLVKADGSVGIKRFLQAVILFFVVKNPSMMKFAPSFMKLLYEQEMLSEELIIGWHSKKIKLDKKCALYDRKCEKAFRKQI